MRALFVLLLVSFLAVPASAGPGAPVAGGADVDLPDRECMDCAGATVWVAQTEPKNCNDCGGVGVVVGASNDEATHVDAQVCRGGFVYFCVVDEHRTVRL